MAGTHRYSTTVEWTGNTGEGTRTYKSYERAHVISVTGKPPIPGSSDPAFRGDPKRYNPEDLLVASLSTCHMLWFLHLACNRKFKVTRYRDDAVGVLAKRADGKEAMTRVTLRPAVSFEGAAPTPEQPRPRPVMVPDSFRILVVEPR